VAEEEKHAIPGRNRKYDSFNSQILQIFTKLNFLWALKKELIILK
jgi:hypothetical protein